MNRDTLIFAMLFFSVLFLLALLSGCTREQTLNCFVYGAPTEANGNVYQGDFPQCTFSEEV